jgi:hypothetical protein
MPEKDQKMRFTKSELALFRNVFSENEPLLYAVRKFMLGFQMEELEQSMLDKYIQGDVYKLVCKLFNPQLDPNAPLFQLVDMSLGLNVDIKGQTEDNALPFIVAKAIEKDYISQQLSLLGGNKLSAGELITLEGLADLGSENAYVNIIARNYLLSYIDSYVNEAKFLSSMKENETHEEAIERLKKNSNK